jgi:hypothetical protein
MYHGYSSPWWSKMIKELVRNCNQGLILERNKQGNHGNNCARLWSWYCITKKATRPLSKVATEQSSDWYNVQLERQIVFVHFFRTGIIKRCLIYIYIDISVKKAIILRSAIPPQGDRAWIPVFPPRMHRTQIPVHNPLGPKECYLMLMQFKLVLTVVLIYDTLLRKGISVIGSLEEDR